MSGPTSLTAEQLRHFRAANLGFQLVAIDGGKASSGSTNTLVDETKRWETNIWVGSLLIIRRGAAGQSINRIVSNTFDTLTVTTAFAGGGVPDVTSEYEIWAQYPTMSQGAPDSFVNTNFDVFTIAQLTVLRAVPIADPNTWYDWRGFGLKTQTSAANTAQTIIIPTYNLAKMLAIDMQATGGTATVQVSGSIDNATYIDLEAPIAAALRTDKMYFAGTGTVGATIALSPLAFPFIKIVAGAAGIGFTTTLIVSIK